MDTPLQTPNPPVNMLKGYVSQEETAFTIHCHDSSFKKVTALNSNGQLLFRVEGTTFGTSWSWRRKIFDDDGRRLFDFRHNRFDVKNNGWIVESADSEHYQLCSLEHKSSQFTRQHSAINATVRTQAGEDVLVLMRPNDQAATITNVSVSDTTIATIHKVENNSSGFRGQRDRSVWKARVASGMDLSLIMVLVLCRAEMGHVHRQ